MAIAHDTSTAAGNVTSDTLTFAHTCTGRNLILFVGILATNDYTITVTYAGVSMTQIAKLDMASANDLYLFYLLAPATGANNVIVSASGSGFLDATASSYTGVRQSGQPDASTTQSTPGATTLTATLTTVADNCWTVMVGRALSNGAITAGTGTTERAGDPYCPILDSNGVKTPPGSTSLQFTTTPAQDLGAVMASFSPYNLAGRVMIFS